MGVSDSGVVSITLTYYRYYWQKGNQKVTSNGVFGHGNRVVVDECAVDNELSHGV
jgi:hypothetical protein